MSILALDGLLEMNSGRGESVEIQHRIQSFVLQVSLSFASAASQCYTVDVSPSGVATGPM